jgi:hypothetical protein
MHHLPIVAEIAGAVARTWRQSYNWNWNDMQGTYLSIKSAALVVASYITSALSATQPLVPSGKGTSLGASHPGNSHTQKKFVSAYGSFCGSHAILVVLILLANKPVRCYR